MSRYRNAELVLGALGSTLLWVALFTWLASYTPSEKQKEECFARVKTGNLKLDECKNFWEKVASDPIAFFTIVLAFSTVGLWFATYRLYLAGERQIDAAQSAADAAQRSADSFIATERPHLFISAIEPSIRDDLKDKFAYTLVPRRALIAIIIRNYGRTPAVMTRRDVQLCFSKGQLPIAPHQLFPIPIILQPNDNHKFNVAQTELPTESIAAELNAGKRHFWLHFSISYRSVAGGSLHHISGKWKYNLALDVWDPEEEIVT
jgi:hypothetical protein